MIANGNKKTAIFVRDNNETKKQSIINLKS